MMADMSQDGFIGLWHLLEAVLSDLMWFSVEMLIKIMASLIKSQYGRHVHDSIHVPGWIYRPVTPIRSHSERFDVV